MNQIRSKDFSYYPNHSALIRHQNHPQKIKKNSRKTFFFSARNHNETSKTLIKHQ